MYKRYYYLKLESDYLSSPKIKKLRKVAGGDTYTIIYLKMQLLSIKNGGIIEYSGIEKTFEEELSLTLDEDVENIKMTLLYLTQQNLIEKGQDNEYLLPDAANKIGSESESAERMRMFRKKQKASLCYNDVRTCDVIREIEEDKDKDKDKDIEIEIEIEKRDKSISLSTIVDLYHVICPSFPKVRTLTENRKKALNARLRTGYTLEDFQRLFEMAERSDFLKGKNNRNWSADFDWLIKDANMAKVLEGKYENKERSVDSGTNQGYVPSGKFAKYNGLEL